MQSRYAQRLAVGCEQAQRRVVRADSWDASTNMHERDCGQVSRLVRQLSCHTSPSGDMVSRVLMIRKTENRR
ncbi:hypothetical protein BW737_007630 [Actinomyces ruminis]|uniref:Uncharacterized protein n=1 Tax=Actinomyces ruminis TaxID=1937003 RepID=A0ABX4MBU3_9ACTO|nr:hypothetical protein BW737_007630 [Actinomyces ruminis]